MRAVLRTERCRAGWGHARQGTARRLRARWKRCGARRWACRDASRSRPLYPESVRGGWGAALIAALYLAAYQVHHIARCGVRRWESKQHCCRPWPIGCGRRRRQAAYVPSLTASRHGSRSVVSEAGAKCGERRRAGCEEGHKCVGEQQRRKQCARVAAVCSPSGEPGS